MKFLTVIAMFSLLAGCSNRVDHTSSPHSDRVAPFYSAHVMPRNVDIWLPREYESKPGQRFPVLYMHDGQNLFDHADASLGIAWDIDRVAQQLMDAGRIKPAIIVAIWSSPKRHLEYLPTHVVTANTIPVDVMVDASLADSYLTFIVRELKPYVDHHYRTLGDRENTHIAGSDLGALISLYAVAEYPRVFGSVACISPDWSLLFTKEVSSSQRSVRYLDDKLPVAGSNRFYFYESAISGNQYNQSPRWLLDGILHKKGYIHGVNWQSEPLPSGDYDENTWQLQVNPVFEFLLRPNTGK